MQRMVIASIAVMTIFTAMLGGATIGVSAAGASAHANKAAFCAANDSIDRASASVTSNAGFLTVLKSHSHDLLVMQENAPPGALGQLVNQVVKVAEKAISSNNPSLFNSLPNGAGIDTYCGVNGNGQPLPGYFGTGKTTAFCSTFVPLYEAAGNASSAAGVLAALTAHKAQISKLASELSTLPASIKAKATAAVHNVQKAILSNSVKFLGGNGNGPASYVALYCGLNE
jgi:hypothetical protein